MPVLTAGVSFFSSFVKRCHVPPELPVPVPVVGRVRLADGESAVSFTDKKISSGF